MRVELWRAPVALPARQRHERLGRDNPAFSYTGLALRGSSLVDGVETTFEPKIHEADQFTREIDHMSACIATGTPPHTGGAEGLRDMQIIAAIYRAAETGRVVAIEAAKGPTRGPSPA